MPYFMGLGGKLSLPPTANIHYSGLHCVPKKIRSHPDPPELMSSPERKVLADKIDQGPPDEIILGEGGP